MAKKKFSKRVDVYETVTNELVEKMEQGVTPWKASWDTEVTLTLPHNLTGYGYNGINSCVLMGKQMTFKYKKGYWLTYNQAKKLGGNVKAGEKGVKTVFFKFLEKETDKKDSSGKPVVDTIPLLKFGTVFNIEQIENLKQSPTPPKHTGLPLELINASGIEIRHGGGRAYYNPKENYVRMPAMEDFKSEGDYYAVLFHEMVHATASYVNRDTKDYAFEELVAELGATFLMAAFEMKGEYANHESYLSNWLKAMKGDKKFIFAAAKEAQTAVDWLLNKLEDKEDKQPLAA